MAHHSFRDAVQAFERINTLGVKLKKEDIESANVAARHSGFVADEVVPFLERLRSEGFSRINIMHLFRACAFVAKPDGRNRTPLHELEKTEVLRAWKQTERATVQAIGLIRSELGLKCQAGVPYCFIHIFDLCGWRCSLSAAGAQNFFGRRALPLSAKLRPCHHLTAADLSKPRRLLVAPFDFAAGHESRKPDENSEDELCCTASCGGCG